MTDPIKDIKKAFEIIRDDKRPPELVRTIHNPKCRCVETGNIRDCNCRILMFRS